MASPQGTMTLNPVPNFDELHWIIQIRRTFDEVLEDDNGIPVCIFSIPQTLVSYKPDSYIPQHVALGPYHHWSSELYEMENYKLFAAKRTQERLQSLNFHHLVDHLMKLEPMIRACYHKYLDINGETLAWMMAIDASFLLEFLQIYDIREGRELTRVSFRMSHLLDHTGRKLGHNAILKDVAMLENQIPLFLLRKILEFQYSSLEMSDHVLRSILMGLCKELCPFKMMKHIPSLQFMKRSHLLDFLYHLIVPESEEPSSEIIDADNYSQEPINNEGEAIVDSSYVKKFFTVTWEWLSTLNNGPVSYLKGALFSRPVKIVASLPWKIIIRLPGFSILKQPMECLFFTETKQGIETENTVSGSYNNITNSPLIEEITIPSVAQLCKAGVRFLPTEGDLTTISFDKKTVTLYLPTVSLDVNTEVVLRNLVAYEASTASGPLVFTRYTELMNGIIDTEEDVRLLRKRGIVLNRLKGDKEVANLWNGMSTPVRLTRVPLLDKVIDDVNKYYNGTWRVKAGKFMKAYVFGSWEFLTFLAAILLFLLMTLQAFCSVYSCARLMNGKTI